MSKQIIWENGHSSCIGCVCEYETCGHYITETGECDLSKEENNNPTTANTREKGRVK